MAEEISNPLLSLIREQGLIDDLQYEDVVAEMKRSNASAIQVLQDFGVMKLDDILHVEATYLGTEVVSLKDREISADLQKIIPATAARMYRCVPVGIVGDVVQVAVAEPLYPARADEIQYSAKRDIQIVVADPADIDKTIDRIYGQSESENFAEILRELGAGKDIANPFAALLTAGMLLAHLGWPDEEKRIERVVTRAIDEQQCTVDVGGKLGTRAAAAWVRERVAAEL